MSEPTFSNGAAYADFDNDGDLDVVINNINDEAILYQNNFKRNKQAADHYLQIKLEGNAPNTDGFGAWIKSVSYTHLTLPTIYSV